MDDEHWPGPPLPDMLQNTLPMYPSMHPCIRQLGVCLIVQKYLLYWHKVLSLLLRIKESSDQHSLGRGGECKHVALGCVGSGKVWCRLVRGRQPPPRSGTARGGPHACPNPHTSPYVTILERTSGRVGVHTPDTPPHQSVDLYFCTSKARKMSTRGARGREGAARQLLSYGSCSRAACSSVSICTFLLVKQVN
jgi:hypothetical protein